MKVRIICFLLPVALLFSSMIVCFAGTDGAEEDNIIYLTYDDGPAKYTTELLDVLDEYGAKATFFIVGSQAERNPDVIDAIVSAGHSIGIHCYSHQYEKLYLSETSFLDDLEKARQLIVDQTDSQPMLLRFPGGSETAASCLKDGGFAAVTDSLSDKGMKFYDWDVSATVRNDGVSGAVRRVCNTCAETHGSSIVLLHDTQVKCAEVTRGILEWGSLNGYVFKAL